MTQVERLIRNLTEARRLQITDETRAEAEKVPGAMKLSAAPRAVRLAVSRYRAAEKVQKAAKAVVKKHGFSVYNLESREDLIRERAHTEREAVNERGRQRITRVMAMRHTAQVATLGKTVAESQIILTKLQGDLAKV